MNTTTTTRIGIRLVCCLALGLLVAACEGEGEAETGESETGEPQSGVTFVLDFDASSLCGGSSIERVEFSTRRVDCWDPELPCTISQDPPWITGTALDCADIGSTQRWEIALTATGQYETQLRALSSGTQQGVHCYAAGGGGRTRVANEDLQTNVEFQLTEAPDSDCSNP